MNIFGDTDRIEEYGTSHPHEQKVEGVVVVGYDPDTDKWLALKSKKGVIWLVGGGKEDGEEYSESAIRELKEESGYHSFKEQIQLGGPIISHYFNDKKGIHRNSYSNSYLFILDSEVHGEQELEEHEDFSVVWLDYEELRGSILKTGGGVEHWIAVLQRAKAYLSSL